VDDEFDEWDLGQLDEAGTMLLGRVTYDGFAEFWSSAEALDVDPVRAKLLTAIPKVVVSTTMAEAPWANTTIAGTGIEAELRRLKELPGKNIQVIGSAKLTSWLIETGLLDELRVMVSPVLLGTGIPAFPVSRMVGLDLAGSRQFGNGNMLLIYRPRPEQDASAA
jgi:dihydrofolate reductase